MDLNLVVLAGRLAAPPELRSFESGSSLLRLLVTVRTSTPRNRIDVVPVSLWDPPTDVTDVLPVRGERVWVAGSVQRRFWESPDGRRSRLEVVAHQVQRDVECGDATGVSGTVHREGFDSGIGDRTRARRVGDPVVGGPRR